MRKIRFVLVFLVAALAGSCTNDSSKPLLAKYHKEDHFAPLYDEKGKRLVDSVTMSFIIQGTAENELNGISNEDKTYQDLYETGQALAVKQRASELSDSTQYRINGEEHNRK